METYDAIVAGVGGMGSATLFHLAKRGLRVLGLDRFGVPNDRGSSYGETRIIRKAYFEHPDYVPLLHRAYALWRNLEDRTGLELFRRTGLLQVGMPDGQVVSGVKLSAARHRLPVENIPAMEVAGRFPGFRANPNMEALFEHDAGFLHVDRCVEAHASEARDARAIIRTHEAIRDWTVGPAGVTVETDQGRYAAAALAVCSGPWTSNILTSLSLPLTVRRKPVFWYETRNRTYALERNCPVFCFDTEEGFFYGCPTTEGETLKIAEHSGGEDTPEADALDRSLRDDDPRRVLRFAERHLPDVVPRLVKSSVCMYTMTPDQHFILDRHPRHENVVIAAGFSGHGFKFAPIVGSILADLIVSGRTEEPATFLSLSRPALQGG